MKPKPKYNLVKPPTKLHDSLTYYIYTSLNLANSGKHFTEMLSNLVIFYTENLSSITKIIK